MSPINRTDPSDGEERECDRDRNAPTQDSAHVSSSRDRGSLSIWLYAGASEIAAALESHRTATVRALQQAGFTRQISDEAFDLAIVNFYRSQPEILNLSNALARWVRRTAYHRAKELRNREVVRVLMPHLPDRMDPSGAEELVDSRAALRSVLEAVGRLRPEYRDAVLTVIYDQLIAMGLDGPHVSALARHLELHEMHRPHRHQRLHRARTLLRRIQRGLVALPPAWALRRTKLIVVGTNAIGAASVGVVALAAIVALAPSETKGFVPGSARLAERTMPSLARVPETVDHGGPNAPTAVRQRTPSQQHGARAEPSAQRPILRTPSLPLSRLGVEATEHERSPGDRTLLCARDELASVCIKHPLADSPSMGEAITSQE